MPTDSMNAAESEAKGRTNDFIREIIARDLQSKKHGGRVVTRFPPEPNGYLHIGHAKSICLNFGIAREFGGTCHLRFDDTNPAREETTFVQSIQEDVRWLGFDWGPKARYASDYFDRLYEFALELIRKGKAYVCDLPAEAFRRTRGTPTSPGQESPWRQRGTEENLDLFARMRRGEFPDGAKTLRARIDMTSPNLHLRDPALYRIRKVPHHRTGGTWCLYPTYDFTHCLSDAIEKITHSLCTLEFEVHRPLYDWVLENVSLPRPLPRQYEFARLNLNYTVLSKRKLAELVKTGAVSGWDDPRMPTLSGLRRRGVPPETIRRFCHRIGVTRYDGLTDIALFEHTLRQDLNRRALRRFAVLRPLRVRITNLPEDHQEELEAINNPEDPSAGTRTIPFTHALYIEADDFMEDPPKKYFRLRPGGEVRLRYAYIMKCEDVIKAPDGCVKELRCTIDPESKRGGPTAGRKIKGTLHWVSARHCLEAEVRLFDRLFNCPEPDMEDQDFKAFLNPRSLEALPDCKLEPCLRHARLDTRYQFERLGYFCLDPGSATRARPVFNRTVSLRDSWAKARRA